MSNINNFYNENSINSFEEARIFLRKDPYFLDLKEENDLYRISHIVGKSDMNNEIVKTFSGLILDKNDITQIHYKGQNLSQEILVNNENKVDKDSIKEIDINDWENIKVYKLYDGSRIKLFYHNEKWNVASSRCINADKAYWHSKKSFFKMFMECIGDYDFDQLDKTKCYAFIIQHPENRIVIKHENPSLIHISTYDKQLNTEIECNIGIPRPEEYHFETFEELVNTLSTFDHNSPGYMLMDKSYNRVRIVSYLYDDIRKLKGNVCSMSIRYLQLRKSDPDKISKFFVHYPEYKILCENIEQYLETIYIYIYQKYKMRRRQHKRVVLTQIESEIHYSAHGLYLGLLQQNDLNKTNVIKSITLNDIRVLVSALPVYKLYQLLVDYKFNF